MVEQYGLKLEEITEVVTDAHLNDFTQDCGKNWEVMPVCLDLKTSVVCDVKQDSHIIGERSKRQAFFAEWKTRKESDATYEKLVDGLLENGDRADADAVCQMLLKSLRDADFKESLELPMPPPLNLAKSGIVVFIA